jgi:phosphoglycolate phosphatase-like HAD superfamily hydrolase
VSGATIDSAEIILSQPQVLLLFVLNFNDAGWIDGLKSAVAAAQQKGIPVAVVSANFEEAQKAFTEAGIGGLQFFNTDFTVVRTVARTNPTLVLLRKGTVVNKWSRMELDKASRYLSSNHQ